MATNNYLQSIAILIYINNETLSIVSFYSPTSASPTNFNCTRLDTLIKSIPEPLILAGDFNAHHTIWGCVSTDTRETIIIDVITDNNLCLLNDDSTTTVGCWHTHTWKPWILQLFHPC